MNTLPNRRPTPRGPYLPVLFLMLLFLSLSACSGKPPALSIGEVEFSEDDLLGFSGTRRTRLAEISAFGLAVAREEESKLGDPLVARRTLVLRLEALEREVALQLAGVDEEVLEARYQTNPDYELSVRHLVVLVEKWAGADEEAQARAKAQAALDRILAGEDFAQVAGEVSEEPGARERGGLLRPGRRDTWVEEFWNAAVGLEVGEVSPVIQTPYGFHVLKLEGRTLIPFPEARFHLVEKVAALLPDQSEALKAWTDSVSASLTLDSVAVATDWEEAGSLFVLAAKTLRETNPQGGPGPVERRDIYERGVRAVPPDPSAALLGVCPGQRPGRDLPLSGRSCATVPSLRSGNLHGRGSSRGPAGFL